MTTQIASSWVRLVRLTPFSPSCLPPIDLELGCRRDRSNLPTTHAVCVEWLPRLQEHKVRMVGRRGEKEASRGTTHLPLEVPAWIARSEVPR